uniref:Glycoside hydrolase family 19 catalytic domain-containing protein n=1 Tax=Ascaris lumbricoides TaxID=6252 RepID=A0A9J2PJ26_ASCLU
MLSWIWGVFQAAVCSIVELSPIAIFAGRSFSQRCNESSLIHVTKKINASFDCPPQQRFGMGPPSSCAPPSDPNNLPPSELETWFTKDVFEDLFPYANIGWGPNKCWPYSYEAFVIAARYFPGFGTSSPNTVYTKEQNTRRDLAAFFAQALQETGANDASLYGGGRTVQEANDCYYRGGFYNWFEGGPVSSFLNPNSPGYQPNDGRECNVAGIYCSSSPEISYWYPCKGSTKPINGYYTGCYFGRGALQISYNYNYGQFQNWLHSRGINVNLLAEPNLVLTKMDPPIAVLASLWFYMTPQPPKPAMHDIIIVHSSFTLQISYNYNYGQFQNWLHSRGINVNLLAEPNLVLTKMDPPIAVLASLWFYMTPQPPKPAMHDIIIGLWNPGPVNKAAGYTGPIFGPTSLIINNECGGEDASNPGGPGESRRIKAFKWFCNYFGVPYGEQRLLSCKDMPQKFDMMRYNLSYQPDWSSTWKSEPCQCAPATYAGLWNPGPVNKAAGYTGPIFGPTSLIINNECGGEDASNPGGPGESRRIKAFKWFCNYFGVPYGEQRLLSCKDMPQKFDMMRYNLSYQPDWSSTWKSEPCQCAPATYAGIVPYFDPDYYPEEFVALNEENRKRCVISVYENPSMYGMVPALNPCLEYDTMEGSGTN